jgi:hypothetical protein
MSFYPVFNILDAEGFVNLANFPPNTWEIKPSGAKNIYAFWADGDQWISKSVGQLAEGHFKEFKISDIRINNSPQLINGVYTSDLVLLQLRQDVLHGSMATLPEDRSKSTVWPEWRASIGFRRNDCQVSYQGEIIATPEKATLLTFHPFIQYDDAENFLVFVNIENSPLYRWSNLFILNGSTGENITTLKVRNNAVNVIPLDLYGFRPSELPVFYCDSMAGIPFGFAKSKSTAMLSLEHTHPPASLTLFGNRFKAQKYIKSEWSKLAKREK